MSRRTNVAFPIVFAALGILFITTILVAWNIMFTQYFVLAKEETAADLGTGYWFILAIGDLLLLMVVVIVVLFMVSGIRHVRYRHRQDTFIDSVTHELKSPLAGLRLGVDTLDRRELTRDEKTKFLTMMRDDVDRLQRFIEQLLEAGRLAHGERAIEVEPVNLGQLLEQCADKARLRHELTDDAVIVDLECPDGDRVDTDPAALETIVMNLLDNAVKYSPERVLVTVSVRPKGHGVVIEVCDEGIGIAAKQLKKVFQRFHRVRRAAAAARGTGLGLFVVQELVRELGGSVSASSEGEGKGSCFHVVLPLRMT